MTMSNQSQSDVNATTANSTSPAAVTTRLREIAQGLKSRTSIVKAGLTRQQASFDDGLPLDSTTRASFYSSSLQRSFSVDSESGEYDDYCINEQDAAMQMPQLSIQQLQSSSAEFTSSKITPAESTAIMQEAILKNWFGVLSNGALDPSHAAYKILWLTILSTIFVYNFVSITLRCSFPFYQQPKTRLVAWLVVDYLTDSLLLLDMLFVKPRLALLRHDGLLLTDRQKLRITYFMSWTFGFDIIALLPLDLFYLAINAVQPYFRLLRLLHFRSYRALFLQLQKQYRSSQVILFIRMIGDVLLLFHLLACLYHAFSKNLITDGAEHWPSAYAKYYYLALKATITHDLAANPATTADRCLMVLFRIVGVGVKAFLVAQITEVYALISNSDRKFNNQVKAARALARRFKCPNELEMKLINWFKHSREVQNECTNEQNLANWLPKHLNKEIALAIYYPLLQKQCSRSVIAEVLTKTKLELFFPDDIIYKKDDVAKQLFYIILSGQVEVLDDSGAVTATLKEGSVFGETGLLSFSNYRRTTTVRSKSYTHLFTLLEQDFYDVIIRYPKIYRRLQKDIGKSGFHDTFSRHKENLHAELNDELVGSMQLIPVINQAPVVRTSTPKLMEVILSFWHNSRSTWWKRLVKVNPMAPSLDDQNDGEFDDDIVPEFSEMVWSSPSPDEFYVHEDWELQHYKERPRAKSRKY